MKKFFGILTISALCLFGNVAQAGSISGSSAVFLIDDDATEIAALTQDLSPLEAYLSANTDANFSSVQAQNPNLLHGISAPTLAGIATAGGGAPFLPAICWGAGLNILGVGVVYVTTDGDRGEMRGALVGCLINSLLLGGGWAGFLS